MAENNLIKKSDLARVREVEFVNLFGYSIKKLMEALGITRKIAKQAGTMLKSYKATGTLESGAVAEGETIPLSKYITVPVNYKEITLKKWRKATTAEAIIDRGYDQAVDMTTDEMLKDVQKGIRADFFKFLGTGTGAAYGETFQAALAQTWGQLQILFEDDEIRAVYFMNPLDVADYLATANITLQNAFGMNYVENFLGLGTVIFNSSVPKGTVYATAADNIVLYYIPVNGADLSEAFTFTSDDTGYIGIHEEPDYTNMTSSDTVVNGMELFAERIDGVVVASIGKTAPQDIKTSEQNDTLNNLGGAEMNLGNTVTKVSNIVGEDFALEKTTGVNYKAVGTAKKVSGWTEFSSDPEDATGHYIPVVIPDEYEGKEITVYSSTGPKTSTDRGWVIRVDRFYKNRQPIVFAAEGRTIASIDVTSLNLDGGAVPAMLNAKNAKKSIAKPL